MRAALAVAVVLSSIGACVAAPAIARVENTPLPASSETAIAEFIALANEARRASGCHATLVWDDAVAAVAVAHSEDMRRFDYFSHVDRRGRTPMERLLAADIPVRAAAENIALGHANGRAVFDAWRASPGHNRNMTDCGYTHHGLGLVSGYWTHVLIRRPMPRRR